MQDAFGPFSDSAATNGVDPFTFSSNFSEDTIEETSFDSFGDFGDFQSGGSGSIEGDRSLTPTGADSWSFASTSSTGSFEDGAADRRASEAQAAKDGERTARDS